MVVDVGEDLASERSEARSKGLEGREGKDRDVNDSERGG